MKFDLMARIVCSTLPALVSSTGFCLNEVPQPLEGTGYTGTSNLSDAECKSGGFDWCPLRPETALWGEGSSAVEYYVFSPCCSGPLSDTLLVDGASGYPTCKLGKSSGSCTRTAWQTKLMADLLGDDYDSRVPPSNANSPQETYQCTCSPSDPSCTRASKDGTTCLICATDSRCGHAAVSFGLNVFKLVGVDLQSSRFSLSAWIRQSWRDERLAWDRQCYGGVGYIGMQSESGSLENTLIWSPDVELYNHEASIWAGFPARLATVYACPEGPARTDCGYVYLSRPGLLNALCKFEGLVLFPFDELRCEVEFGAWALDGSVQDILPTSEDGGITWLGGSDQNGDALVGLTAGSQFQDYTVKNITAKRYVVEYSCCPGQPWPELVYKFTFQRATSYYMLKLIVPTASLATMSFLTFWMPVRSGERLGYGITVILAMFANDITVSQMMPVCSERTVMDYINFTCFLLGCLSLLETVFVLMLANQTSDRWTFVLVPKVLRDWLRGLGYCCSSRSRLRRVRTGASIAKDFTTEEKQVRVQLYAQIFYRLDDDFSGSLSLVELAGFGTYLESGQIWEASTCNAQSNLDDMLNQCGGQLTLPDFCAFCDENMPHLDDSEFVKEKLTGFLQIAERRHARIVNTWLRRAAHIDDFAKWAVPPGFLVFLVLLTSMSEEDLMHLDSDSGLRVLFMMSSSLVFLTLCAAFFIMRCQRRCQPSEDLWSKGLSKLSVVPAFDDTLD